MEEDLLDICGFDSSKKYRLEELIKYHSGSCIEFEDVEEDDEMEVDYQCPFYTDDYDLVELCHHIDEEHHLDANNGASHESVSCLIVHCPLVIFCNKSTSWILRLYKDESYSALSPGKKKYVQSLIDGPLSTNHASKGVPDSLLSFVYYNPPSPNQPKLVLPDLSSGANTQEKCLTKDSTEKEGKSLSPLSDTELLEKIKKREFVQGLISSVMFNHTDDF
ncbi:unnamed protein product [Brassica oleracea var. botrytis]|uniref:(rape) hypothetical protein n=1 Tax=Brassica napus TaxID=3708 RepID=A0A816I6A7_BRANA|nr:unnamed protein product [Brassica napus]